MDPAWITAALALAAAVLGCLAWLGRKVWRGWQRTENFLDDWGGHPERPGVPARPGVMERLQSVEFTLGEVRGQIFPNGGTSMRDDLNAVRSDVTEIKNGTEELPMTETPAPRGPQGTPGMQGQRGRPGETGRAGKPGISTGTMRAFVALLVLVLIVGGANLWGSWDQVHSFKEQLHAQQVAEQKAAAKEIGELCSTFGKVALLKPPAGNPVTNPSRAFDQSLHADLAGVNPDLGCTKLRGTT